MAKWRYYAARELPRVVRELHLPCAVASYATGMTHCPRHQEPLGSVTRTCARCHDEAWAEVGRRYASAAQGREVRRDQSHNPRGGQHGQAVEGRLAGVADGLPVEPEAGRVGPPMPSVFPGRKPPHIPGQLALGETINPEPERSEP